jgi:hypothetical protein
MLVLAVAFIAASRLSGCAHPLADDAIELRSPEVSESSGLAVSRLNPSVIWTHNDSGDSARLFAFDLQGNCLAELTLDEVKATDWEDMCSFTHDGRSYLAVGDVGDNNRKRKKVAIHVFAEPHLGEVAEVASSSKPQQIQQLECDEYITIEVEYPQPVDCESLAYDPRRAEFLLCSKETLASNLYRVPVAFDLESAQKKKSREQQVKAVAEQVASIPLATAADISADGELLTISTYGPAFVLPRATHGGWETDPGRMRIFQLPNRRQGESICFSSDQKHVLLTSEFRPTPLWKLPFDMEKTSAFTE